MTVEKPEFFEPEMKILCSLAGVAVVFVSELPETHLSGAAKWLNKDKALIILSLRYKTDDYFWFSFFHEACHILCHEKKTTFFDEMREKDKIKDEQENEANNFAANLLINNEDYQNFISQNNFNSRSIKEFASNIEIAPGIIVGRLQHDEYIPFSWCNKLKRKFALVESTR